MRGHLLKLLLRQYIEHKNPANLRLHVVSNGIFWLAFATLLSQVPLPWTLPFRVPVLGANLGAVWAVGSALYWLAVDLLVPAVVLGATAAWAALPFAPWGPGHGWLAGVVLPVVVATSAGLAALYAHIYHHEHAPYLETDDRLGDALETTHAVFWGAMHFWLCALLARGYRPSLRGELDAAERGRILRQSRVSWSNWGGTARCRPQVVSVPLTVDDLGDVVREAARDGRRVRVLGSGFTWAGWVPTDDTLVFCERLDRIEIDRSDPEHPAIWAECGATNRQINAALASEGLQLPWNVVLETVRVAGIVSVGTHGSGKDTATMGDLVLALDVVDATGARRILSEETIGAEAMAAARMGFGIFGVIARVRLRVEAACHVLQIDRKLPIDAALSEMADLVRTKDSVELFWFPFNDWMWVRTFERTLRPRTAHAHGVAFLVVNFLQMLLLSLVSATSRRAPRVVPWMMRKSTWLLSFRERVLPLAEAVHFRRWIEVTKCSCVEIGFKVDDDFANAREAFEAATRLVREWAARGRYPLDLTVNVRFTGPSRALLSPCYGPGITCFIEALCMGRNADWEPFTTELCRAWMSDPTALPHWAKEFEHVPGLSETARERLGDRRTRFCAAWRATGVDPAGVFVNPLVQRVFL
jgi:hypothetical protein